jgi:hypothetical protein
MMIENEWHFESFDLLGNKISQEGTYDDEYMYIFNNERFADLMNENQKTDEEIFNSESEI